MNLLRWSLASCLAASALSSGCSSDGPTATDGGVDVATDRGAVTDLGSTTDRSAGDTGSAMTCGATLGPCNLVTNAPCAAGTGCYAGVAPDGTLGASCAESGRRGWGEACTTANGCREGFACLGTPGACVKLCCENDNASCRDETRGGRPGAICAGGVTGTDVHTCTEVTSCDLYATSANRCPAERPRCDLLADDGTANCFALEAGATPGGDGATCCTNSRCQPGFLCVPATPGGGTEACVAAMPNRACRRVCNPTLTGGDAGAQCPAARMCVGFSAGAPESYGRCEPMR